MTDKANRLCIGWQHGQVSTLRRDIHADIVRYLSKSAENIALGDGFRHRLSAFLTPEIQCLTIYRFAHYCHARGWRSVGALLAKLNFVLFKVTLPAASCIGPGCRLSHPAGVIFRGNAGSGLTLFGMAMCYERFGPERLFGSLDLGNNVSVGAHSVLIGPISVGSNSKVAPFAVLSQDAGESTTIATVAMRSVLKPRGDGSGSQ